MPLKFKTVLVIEDDHDIRVTLRQVYEAAGYYVFTVTNGHSALELLKIIPPPKLMVCDIKMPLMDGVSFVRHKTLDDTLRNVPLIIISAFQDKFCEFPGIHCLPKPLDLYELIRYSESCVNDPGLIPKR